MTTFINSKAQQIIDGKTDKETEKADVNYSQLKDKFIGKITQLSGLSYMC